MAAKLVVLARIGSPHGVVGKLNVNRAGEHLRSFSGKKVIICSSPDASGLLANYNKKDELEIAQVEPAQGEPTQIKFKTINDRDSAKALTNFLIAVELKILQNLTRAERPENAERLDDLWYFEMFGLAVVDAETQKTIGTIANVEEMGLNTVITIEPLPDQALLAQSLDLPLSYPHWTQLDLAAGTVTLGEWRALVEL
jgi:ribosomal 30S subunit maturation factor RimM